MLTKKITTPFTLLILFATTHISPASGTSYKNKALAGARAVDSTLVQSLQFLEELPNRHPRTAVIIAALLFFDLTAKPWKK